MMTLALLLILATAKPAATPSPKPLQLSVLKQGPDEGCGCAFAKSQKEFNADRFVADINESDQLRIGVDGVDRKCKLKEVSRHQQKHDEMTVGDTEDYLCKGDGFSVKMQKKITGVCAKDDESCEVIDYSLELDVTMGERKGHATLTGNCGC